MSEKSEKISDAVGELDEELIAEADEKRVPKKAIKRRTGKMFKIAVSAAACAAVAIGAMSIYPKEPDVQGPVISAHAETLAEAAYPEMAVYPDESLYYTDNGFDEEAYEKYFTPWYEQRIDRYNTQEKILNTADEFYKASAAEFLSGANGENRAYSPVNVYMALSMLAETTGGNSRTQLLDLLGANSIDTLRTRARDMWTANYRNDGATTSILANSIWLDEDLDFKQDTVDSIAKQYLASVYRGDLSSDTVLSDMRDWLNKQTGGLLTEAAENLEIPDEAVMALCSTVYFKARWAAVFNPEYNDMKNFHSPEGDYETEFMNDTYTSNYYWSEDFGAIALPFADGGTMWFILPDEGKTVDDVLKAGDYLNCEQNEHKYIVINYSVPKFDITSDIDLEDGLKRLGVTDVFDIDTADFTPLSDSRVRVGSAEHAARVTIDEEGCTAAAFTVISADGTAEPPEDKIDFILDRPFLFMIKSDTEQPLFIGEVNKP